MHKNHYNPKVLNGNWQEERATTHFEEYNHTTNTYLKNPCNHYYSANLIYCCIAFNKYVPMSKTFGNKGDQYQRVRTILHNKT